jgi:hypothetical protein
MAAGIPEDRQRQFDHLAEAKALLFAWCERERFPLHRVEFIVPFVATDFRAHVLLFLETDAQVRAESGTRLREAQAVFARALREIGYPEEHLVLVTFEVDSDERVQREFEGSYFYRLR